MINMNEVFDTLQDEHYPGDAQNFVSILDEIEAEEEERRAKEAGF